MGDVTDITKLAGFEFTKYVNYEDSGKIIALRAINVKNNKLDLNDIKYIDNSDFSKLKRSKLYSGDLLLTYIGANIGDVALVPEDDKFYLAPNICRIRSNKEINPIFLKNYFNTNIMINEIKKYINASSQPALLMGNIRKFRFKFPNLIEQDKIAIFLSLIDKKIDFLESKYKYYKDFKKYLMQQIFAQKLRFDDFHDDWIEIKLKDISSMKYGKMPDKDKITDDENKYPIYSGFSIMGYYEEFNIKKNDLLITARGSGTGYVKLAPADCYLTNLSIIIDVDKKIVDTAYLYYYFSEFNLRYLDSGSAQPQLTINDLKIVKFKAPSMHEQKKIVKLFLLIDEKLNLTEKQITHMKKIKKGFLQQMFVYNSNIHKIILIVNLFRQNIHNLLISIKSCIQDPVILNAYLAK